MFKKIAEKIVMLKKMGSWWLLAVAGVADLW